MDTCKGISDAGYLNFQKWRLVMPVRRTLTNQSESFNEISTTATSRSSVSSLDVQAELLRFPFNAVRLRRRDLIPESVLQIAFIVIFVSNHMLTSIVDSGKINT
jgi:hypothetical protein